MPQGLPRKLRHVFVRQAVLSSLMIVTVMALACAYVLDTLIEARLETEAAQFWAGQAADPGYVAPRTGEVSVHLARPGSAAGVPPYLRSLPPGTHALPGFDRHVLVQSGPAGTLYVDMSFAYPKRLLWGASVLIMLVGTAAIMLLAWLTYRSSRRLVMPVSWLANVVAHWEPDRQDASLLIPERMPGEVGAEVQQLSRALGGLSSRVRAFVRRERDFTRDASHELRTPLTVIRVATDMLLSDPDLPTRNQRSLHRIQRAGRDMEAVIDAFLILARENQVEAVAEEFDVREVVLEEVEKVQPLVIGKPVELRVVGEASPRLVAPPRVLGVMLGNLLSNACVFTESGHVEVEIGEDRVVVRDTGIGMSPGTLQRVYDPFYRADQFRAGGKGMGLSIVRRLGERFEWPVLLHSVPGQGTTAEIRFAR